MKWYSTTTAIIHPATAQNDRPNDTKYDQSLLYPNYM